MRSIEWWHCRWPWPWVHPNHPKPPHFLHFAPPFIASKRVHIETSNLLGLYRLSIASCTLPMKNHPWKGVVRVTWVISTFWAQKISPQQTVGVLVQSTISSTVSLWITPIWRSNASWMNAKVYYTFVECNPITQLLRLVLDLSYKLFPHCYAATGEILTDTSRRAVLLR